MHFSIPGVRQTTVIMEIESDGFKFVDEKHFLQENYFLKCIKSAVEPWPTAEQTQTNAQIK